MLLSVEKGSKLYLELYRRYLPPGGKVMDIYAGSASSAVALLERARVTGDPHLYWTGVEMRKEIFGPANKRLLDRAAELFLKNNGEYF